MPQTRNYEDRQDRQDRDKRQKPAADTQTQQAITSIPFPHIARREKFDDKELGLQRLTARSLLASLDEAEKPRDHKTLRYSNQECA
jgi:hypothetical protein